MLLNACTSPTAGSPSIAGLTVTAADTAGAATTDAATSTDAASTAAGTQTGTGAVAAGAYVGTPTPVPSAIVPTGKVVMKASVIRIPATDVESISADGSSFIIKNASASKLAVNGVFVVPAIASRYVIALAPDGDAMTVTTGQASLDQVFSDLRVSFDGIADPTAIRVGDDPVVEAGEDPLGSVEDPDAGTTTDGTTTDVTPTKLRATRSSIAAAGCKARTLAFTVKADPITVKPFLTTNADCSGFVLGADITADKGALSAAFTVTGNVNILKLTGGLSAGASGNSMNGTVKLSGALNLGGQARAEEAGGIQKRYKFGWDAIKFAYPFLVGDVPFVLQVGVPIIIEPRFNGKHDIIQGKYLSLGCTGTLNIGPGNTTPSLDICKLEAAAIESFVNIAPSGFVLAAGLKAGIGPGLVLGGKAIAFVGITGALTAAVGVSATGATSTGLLDCIQVDRSVQILAGVEGKLGPFGFTANRVLAQKTATDYTGSRCPKPKK